MDSKEYQKLIEKSEAVLKQLTRAMEEQKAKFIEAALPFAQEWCKSTVERKITTNAKRTEELSGEQLKEMKEELTSLLQSLHGFLYDKFKEDSLWPHLSGLTEDLFNKSGISTYDIPRKVRERISHAFRPVFGFAAGNLLLKYGYLKVGQDSEWKSGQREKTEYGYAFDLSTECNAPLMAYEELLKQYIQETECLAKNKKGKQEAEAKERWDKA